MAADQEAGPGHDGTRLTRRTLLGATVAGAGATALLGAVAARSPAAGGDDPPTPTVIAHRGASGYRPEHTLGSYQLALDLGADAIEIDLVPTRDHQLVCRHENEISGTTDVAARTEFADRRTTRTVDGERLTGWFTEDFTAAELTTLGAVERLPARRPNNTLYNGRWSVPTLQEVLEWAADRGRERGRPVWLCLELKHPTHFRSLGLDIEEPLTRLLHRHGLHHAGSPVLLQSFEADSLRRMAERTETRRTLLLAGPTQRPYDLRRAGDPRTVADLITPDGLREIAGYAQVIGPTLDLVIPRRDDDTLAAPSTLIGDAHDRGLSVHGYTLRNENVFLPAEFRTGERENRYGDVFGATRAYLDQGIDGIHTDHPDTMLLVAADRR
ncbi:glycerophosphodiester phosphodiesterase family protein [Streptomyces xiamenensis]|uniref:glycerophosphodiester phosphodiesterase family protein n=1 Tax=Streptomyces xiamenensis TaxID=408015 RepID=UPI0037CD3E10